MHAKNKALVLDTNKENYERIKSCLEKEGYQIEFTSDHNQAYAILKKQQIEVFFFNSESIDNDDFTIKTKQDHPNTIQIIISKTGSNERTIKLISSGASDYITAPVQYDEMLIVLEKAKNAEKLEAENRRLRSQLNEEYSFQKIVGNSEKIQSVCDIIRRVAKSNANIFIQGESGTGKELIARALHNVSPRKDKAFVAINCGVISEQLMESELFGHKKGAFTGATSDKKGLFQIADEGTLFLDEIGDMPPSIQAKILRAIQTKSFRPIGSTEIKTVNARIISATNINLEQAVQRKNFREDLFYRLNVIQIISPSLRERSEDISLLAMHFLKKFNQRAKKNITAISQDAMKLLKQYHYPGNIRELENILERAVALETENTLLPESLPDKLKIFSKHLLDWEALEPSESVEISQAFNRPFDLEKKIADIEKKYINEALRQSKGVKKRAAELLGLSFRSFRYRLSKYGIKLEH